MYWRRRLTRLELAVYTVVIAVALGAFFERGLYYMEVSERAAMEATVLNTNSALAAHAAQALAKGARTDAKFNPFDLMTPPLNYLGAVESADVAHLPRPSWVFEIGTEQLVYLPRLRRHLSVEDPNQVIRYKLRRQYRALKLVPANSYTWRL